MSNKAQLAEEGVIWGMLIADAMSMPVHWYYKPIDIKNEYGGWLKGFVASNKHHPSASFSLSATDEPGGFGWYSNSKSIIGSIILQDKLKYWQGGEKSIHYHQGMQAGENTLNLVVALELLKIMQRVDPKATKSDREVRGCVLQDYVRFMTTPGSHNDTYAESFHRSFFKDWADEDHKLTTPDELLQFTERRFVKKTKEGGNSQFFAVGALSLALPWILRNAQKSESDCANEAIEFVKCTHPILTIIPFVDIYARLLHRVMHGCDLKQEAMQALSRSELGGPQKKDMVLKLLDKASKLPKGSEDRLLAYQSATSTLGLTCHIEHSLCTLLFLAYEFADDFEGGMLANANCGGENCHRGAALGALLGAHAMNQGQVIPKHLKDGLKVKNTVEILLQEREQAQK